MSNFAIRSRTPRLAAQIVAVSLAYYGGAHLGFAQTHANDNVSAIWPPAGIALAAAVFFGTKMWPAVFAGAFFANWAHGLQAPFSLIVACGATAAAVAGARVLEAIDLRPRLDRTRDVAAIIVVALGAAAASATVGTIALSLGQRITTGFAHTWVLWAMGDVMGIILVAPLLLTFGSVPLRENPLVRRPLQALALFTLTVGAVVLALRTTMNVRYLALLAAMWVAAVFEQQGATAITALLAAIALRKTVAGGATDLDVIVLQGTNATLAVVLLTFAAVLGEKRRAVAALRAAAEDLENRVRMRTEELEVANERLTASEQSLEQAQALAHIGSFSWDAATDTNSWSTELRRIYGLQPTDDPPGFEQYISFIREDYRDSVRAAVSEAIEQRRPIGHEYPVVLRDGARRWVHSYVEVITTEAGDFAGLRGTCQDITARRDAEEALRASEQRVKRALGDALEREREASRHLRELDETKNAILSAVSHELRTPLTAILGFAELLREAHVRADIDMFDTLLDRLNSSASRLSHLLQDLLDLTRLQSGAIEPHRETRHVAELIDDALSEIELREHTLAVRVHGETCTVDPMHFSRIIENLVMNAVKYTPADTTITVTATTDPDGGVVIRVDDDGPGIAPELRDTIFQPFVRADSGPFTQGAGVGLSLVDRFARLHGGRAWVEEGVHGGSSFIVYLPGPAKTDPVAPGRNAAA